jgi:hypothetical protein
MLLQINTLEQLNEEAKQIDGFLNITCSEDPEECVNRGLELMAYLARTGKMLADAKYHQNQAVKNSILKEVDINLPASVLMRLINSVCKDENYLVDWIERLNRTATHQMDFLRTVISKAKSERYQNSNLG